MTRTLPKAILGGFMVTSILQSSTVVSLVTLGFVEAAIIPFINALGVIMGANVGSTVLSWIISTVGFRLDIESFSLPGLGLGLLGMFIAVKRKHIHNTFQFLFSISLLFYGIGLMKDSSSSIIANIDFKALNGYYHILFLLLGFIITSIVQTTSATMAVTLTALFTQAITLHDAAAVVIGSEAGSAVKTLLSGLRGSAEKKRAAYGNVFFNIATTIIAYTFLTPILYFLNQFLALKDPLITLAAFQTFINVLTIILFLPFIGKFSYWLIRKYKDDEEQISYVRKNLPETNHIASDAMAEEIEYLLVKTIQFHNLVLDINISESDGIFSNIRNFTKKSGTTQDEYKRLKMSEGDLLEYFVKLQTETLSKEEYIKLNRQMDGLRHIIHAAKSIKDIHHNIAEMRESAKDHFHDYYVMLQNDWIDFREKLLNQINVKHPVISDISDLMKFAYHQQQKMIEMIREDLRLKSISEMESATLMNIQRESLSSKKSLVRGLAYLKIPTDEALQFEYSPED